MIKCLQLDIDSKMCKLQADSTTKDLQDQAKLKSVCAMLSEKHIAIGCVDGTVRIVDYKKWAQIRMIKNAQKNVQEIKYSPNDQYMAVGSHD